MNFQSLKKNQWMAYFDIFSKRAEGQWMQLEVIGEEIGDQIEEDWSLFGGVSYDPPNDTLFVHSQYLEHEILHPKEILAQVYGPPKTIIVKDEAGRLQIIHLRDPVLLEGIV